MVCQGMCVPSFSSFGLQEKYFVSNNLKAMLIHEDAHRGAMFGFTFLCVYKYGTVWFIS